MRFLSRRELLTTTALTLAALPAMSYGAIIRGAQPWQPQQSAPPVPVTSGLWRYFTASEGAAVEALVDRLIPPDAETRGGKDLGCAVFIDRQLAGDYGSFVGWYMSGPFQNGTKEQGPQSSTTPAQQYRKALAALDQDCRQRFAGNPSPHSRPNSKTS